ncbi:hypothetical protein B0H14DRAFT_2620305 [Mycena olivaceomarginata]|nr:hypothetical protein B0H14DRAFT_2620305 [Mycena olivaceomarginata]
MRRGGLIGFLDAPGSDTGWPAINSAGDVRSPSYMCCAQPRYLHTAQNKVSTWVETRAERSRDFCHWYGKCRTNGFMHELLVGLSCFGWRCQPRQFAEETGERVFGGVKSSGAAVLVGAPEAIAVPSANALPILGESNCGRLIFTFDDEDRPPSRSRGGKRSVSYSPAVEETTPARSDKRRARFPCFANNAPWRRRQEEQEEGRKKVVHHDSYHAELDYSKTSSKLDFSKGKLEGSIVEVSVREEEEKQKMQRERREEEEKKKRKGGSGGYTNRPVASINLAKGLRS